MKFLYSRKLFIFHFNVIFIYKIEHMYVLPASHLNVHAAFEPRRAGEQSVFAVLF
jgi:hypothetical protein